MFRKKISHDQYEIFKGIDWPSYSDYCRGVKSQLQHINEEIIALEKTTFVTSSKHSFFKLFRNIPQHQVLIKALLPGIAGLLIFLYTETNYWTMIPICLFFYVINYFYNVGVHRWLSHNQFTPQTWFKYFLLYCSVAVGGFRIEHWVKAHIAHHRYTDTDQDPYSPKRGFWKLFFCYNGDVKNTIKLPKVFDDPTVNFVSKNHTQLYLANLVLFAAIDINLFLLSFLFLKFYAYVLGGLVNYLFHVSDNTITPTNLPWYLEFVFVGECLHKNHHDRPWQFNYGNNDRLDFSYWLIKYFSKAN